MNKFIKENWFKLGILVVLLIAGVSLAYYFVYFLPHKTGQPIEQNRYSYRKIQDSEILAAVPEGYHLAQTDKDKNEVNYIQAHLENMPDDEVVLLLESKQYQLGLFPKNPVMVKVLKYNHESDKWLEYTKTTLNDDTNIKFSYKLINIQGDKTDKLVIMPYVYPRDLIYSDGNDNPVGVKDYPNMYQKAAVLQMKDGELRDIIKYGFGGPNIMNITQAGGVESVSIGAEGSLAFAEYVNPAGSDWKGCYQIHYTRYFFKKDAAEFLTPDGAFVQYDEFTTKNKYTNAGEHTDDPAMVNNGLEKCKYIIFAGSAIIDEMATNSMPTSFITFPKDNSLLPIKETGGTF